MENEKQLENKNLIEKELVTNPDLKDNLEKFIESKTNLEQVDMEEIKKAIMATTQEINKNNVLIAEKLTEQIEFIFKKTQIPTENTSTDNNLTSKEQNNDIAENNIENLNASLNDNLKISETESEQESLIEDNNEISFIDNKNEKRKKKSIKSYISKHSTPQKENIVITDSQTSKLIIDESDEIIENKISQQTENIAEQVDNTINEPIGGVYGLEDEKPLTGSFTLKEQPEDIEEKSVDTLNVPLNGSFGIEPTDEVITEPIVETVAQVENTSIDTAEDKPADEVISTNETTAVVEDEPVVETADETNNETIGGVYGLEDEKPLTGSFTLKEQPEDIEEKSIDTLNVPLNGSFGIEPTDEVIIKPVVETVAQAENTSIDTAEDKPADEVISTNETTVVNEDEPVAETTDETNNETIGGVYGLEDEKPLTGSFTLKEQPEDTEEKSIDTLNVPLNGSFGIEPTDEVITEPIVETVAQAEDKPVDEVISTNETTVVNEDEPVVETAEETNNETIGGVYGLEDEKPLTGSFTLKEQPEDIEEKSVDTLNVPLNGSFGIVPFGIVPTDEVITEPVVETITQNNNITDNTEQIPIVEKTTIDKVKTEIAPDIEDEPVVLDVNVITDEVITEPVVETVAQAENTSIDTVEDKPADEVISTNETIVVNEDEPVVETADETNNETIGGVYGLEDEKPLTGSFTLKEQPEDIEEKSVDTLNVPLNGSFGIEPTDEVITEPVVETVAQAENTSIDTVEDKPADEVIATNETTVVVEDEPVVETADETNNETIGGVYGLEDEKPLTGSFTLKEQPEDIEEKSVDTLNVPLNGSFGIEPTDEVITEPVVETVAQVENTSIDTAEDKPADEVIAINETTAVVEDEPVDETTEETNNETIGGVYGLEDEKPLTGSFTLKEQPEDTEEKSVDTLNVPLNGSFGIEPTDEVITEPVVETVAQVENTSIDTAEDKPADEVIAINETTAVVEDEPVDETTEETNNETIGGVYGLEDEKPLTGSFTLKEQPEDTEEKSVDTLNVPLNGSFGIEPTDEVIAEPIVETVAQVENTSIDTAEDKPQVENTSIDTAEDKPADEVIATNETTAVVEDEPVTETTEETNNETIGGVYGLEDEKPLTGSFTLKEQPEDIEEKSVDTLNVPLNGSFGIEPTDEVITEPVVETVAQAEDKLVDEIISTNETTVVNEEETVTETIEEANNEPIGGVYGLEDEKPLTGSFTLKEQLEYIEQKDVQALDIPLNGSFGIEPADESINEPVIESVQQENETIIETTEEATEVFESTETNTEPVITKTISEESESVNITEPTVEIDNSNKQETSESIQITEEISEYPAIQTVEQSNIETSLPKQEEEKEDEESGLKSLLNEMQSTIYNISAPSEPSIFENLQSANDEKFDLQRITEAILKAAESSGNNDNLSSEKFAEQVRNILEDNNK